MYPLDIKRNKGVYVMKNNVREDILINDVLIKDDESFDDYKIRLCKNKELYGLYWEEIAYLLNKVSGNSFSESFYRKWWKSILDSLDMRDSTIDEIDLKTIQFQKEKIKFYDQRRAYNKIIREESRREDLYEIIKSELSKISPFEYTYQKKEIVSNNDIFVGLNDIHYGAVINNYWNEYSPEIVKKRMGKYLNTIISIGKFHNSENCFVCGNGDFISGNIHRSIDVSNRENVVGQIMGVSELISGFLFELSKHFKTVTFISVAGNHSRITKKENALKDEKLDNLIPWYISARLHDVENVIIKQNDIDSTMNIISIRGLNYLNVHGDYDKWNDIAKTVNMLDIPIYCMHFGHKHHNAMDYIQGYKVVMSGSFVGVDDFCIEKRILGKAQQLIGICTNKGMICTYDIDLQ